jgi:hypothetical protein
LIRFIRISRIADCSGFKALPEHQQWLLQNSSSLSAVTAWYNGESHCPWRNKHLWWESLPRSFSGLWIILFMWAQLTMLIGEALLNIDGLKCPRTWELGFTSATIQGVNDLLCKIMHLYSRHLFLGQKEKIFRKSKFYSVATLTPSKKHIRLAKLLFNKMLTIYLINKKKY